MSIALSFALSAILAAIIWVILSPVWLVGAVVSIVLSPGKSLLTLALASAVALQANFTAPEINPLSWGAALHWTGDTTFKVAVIGALLLIAEAFGMLRSPGAQFRRNALAVLAGKSFASSSSSSGNFLAHARNKLFTTSDAGMATSKSKPSSIDNLAGAMSSDDLPDFANVRRQYGAGGHLG